MPALTAEPISVEQVADAALKLPLRERRRLAERLEASCDDEVAAGPHPPPDGPPMTREEYAGWIAELQRRSDESIARGDKTYTHEEVMAAARRRLG